MDRLQPNQQLGINEELVSNNGWFRLVMQDDGNLVLYRTQVSRALWESNTAGQPVSYAEMQDDGNFVAYSPQGVPQWATGTDGYPGALVVLQDEGNLVVYDSANNALWASNTVQDLLSPTIRYADVNGYSYNETSESWKQLCSSLPCFAALQWPGYATDVVEDVIDGEPVVIQLWKGWCPKFLGFVGVQVFPGGIGAEVGVYRRIPGRIRPTSLPFLPGPLETLILNALETLGDNELWWPFPELGAQIEFTLINPVTGQPFFSAGPETSYWLAKWMDEGGYTQYQGDQGTRWPWLPVWWPGNSLTPAFPEDYILDYRINGRSYPRWPVSVPLVGPLFHTIRFANSWQPWGDVTAAVAGNPGNIAEFNCTGIGGDLHLCARASDGRLWHTIRFANSWQPWGDVLDSVDGNPGDIVEFDCAAVDSQLHLCARR